MSKNGIIGISTGSMGHFGMIRLLENEIQQAYHQEIKSISTGAMQHLAINKY